MQFFARFAFLALVAVAAPALAQTPSDIYYRGDSTCLTGYPNSVYVKVLQARTDITWTGNCTSGMPAGYHVAGPPFYTVWDAPNDLRATLTANTAADCMISMGVNDYKFGDTPEEAADHVMDLARICRDEYGRQVWVTSTFPTTPTSDPSREAWTVELNECLAFFCAAESIPFIDTRPVLPLSVWSARCGTTACDGVGDGIHPQCEECRDVSAAVQAYAIP